MKNIVNRRVRSLFVGGAVALVCGAVVLSAQTAAPESFTALVSRLQQEKPTFAKRQQELLAERYDLADRAAAGRHDVARQAGAGRRARQAARRA